MRRFILICSFCIFVSLVQTLPFDFSGEFDNSTSYFSEESAENDTKASNGTGQDLVVIKTVVYEIGILTDDSNNTNSGSEESQEEIAFSFFNPNHNNSLLDLSNIPVPVQTNISGVTITGVAPANFGTINLLPDGTPTLNASALPLFPNKQVTVTHNFTTIDKSQSALLLDSLSDLLGLKLPKIHDINNGTDSKSSSSTTVTTSTTRGNDLKSTSRSTDSDKRTSENRGSSSSTSTTENTKESSSEIES